MLDGDLKLSRDEVDVIAVEVHSKKNQNITKNIFQNVNF